MTDLIGWAIYGFAQAGEWLLLPAGLATGWAAYRLTTRAVRRNRARRAERAAHFAVLIAEARERDTAAIAAHNEQRPGTNQTDLNECEAIWNTTRKENRP